MGNHDKVELDIEDAAFIVRQLNTAMSRANSGQRMGSHLLKRIRRSKAILLSRIEEWEENNMPISPEVDPVLEEPRRGFFQRLFG